MAWPRGASIAAIVLVVTVSIKAWAVDHRAGQALPGADVASLAVELRDGGFNARIDATRPFVVAADGACKVKARLIDPHGTQRYAMARLDAPYGDVHYVYRGEWSERAPRMRPLLAFYLQRELARVGIVTGRSSVVSLAVAEQCPAPEVLRERLRLDRTR